MWTQSDVNIKYGICLTCTGLKFSRVDVLQELHIIIFEFSLMGRHFSAL